MNQASEEDQGPAVSGRESLLASCKRLITYLEGELSKCEQMIEKQRQVIKKQKQTILAPYAKWQLPVPAALAKIMELEKEVKEYRETICLMASELTRGKFSPHTAALIRIRELEKEVAEQKQVPFGITYWTIRDKEIDRLKKEVAKQKQTIENQEQAIVDLNIVADRQVKDLQERNERQTQTIKKQREMISLMASDLTIVPSILQEERKKNRKLIQRLRQIEAFTGKTILWRLNECP